jgi:hypothetical protein
MTAVHFDEKIGSMNPFPSGDTPSIESSAVSFAMMA